MHDVTARAVIVHRATSRFGRDVRSGRLRLSSGSLTALPLDDKSVDALITVNTVPGLDAACADLARVLRPGGRAVLGIGDPDVMARVEQHWIDEKSMPRCLFISRRDGRR